MIERDPQKSPNSPDLGVIVLVRDATLEESLREAGVEHARGLAACLPDDADNVYVVLTARDLNPQMHIVARAAEEQAEPKLIRAGANRVVAPTIIGAHRMAMALTKPAVDDFLGSITANKLELAFEQLEVDAASILVGQKLSETNIRSELDIVVVSIRRSDGQILFNPSGEAMIQNGDLLIAIGHAESLMKLAIWRREQKVHVQSQCPSLSAGALGFDFDLDSWTYEDSGHRRQGYLGTHVGIFLLPMISPVVRAATSLVTTIELVADYDVVIHLAAYLDKDPAGAELCFRTNAEAAADIVNHMRTGAVLIYASTKDVYGANADSYIEVPETCPTDYAGQTALEWSKLIGERYVEYYARERGVRLCIFRMSNVYARPSLGNESGFVTHYVESVKRGWPIRLRPRCSRHPACGRLRGMPGLRDSSHVYGLYNRRWPQNSATLLDIVSTVG